MNDFLELLKDHITIRLSQLKTLHDGALALIKSGTIGIASIGRNIESNAREKHRIKRMDRFIGNQRLDRKAIASGIFKLLCENKKRTYVCVDWTDAEDKVNTFIEASIPTRSRSIIFWTRVQSKNWDREGSMTRAEEEFLEELRQIIPEKTKVVILADRGFGKVNFFRKVEKLGFEYIVRVTMRNWIHSRKYIGLIEDIRIKPGFRKDFCEVIFTKEHQWNCRLVGLFEIGQKEPWFLATNTKYPFRSVINGYSRRFEIEETNRDIKNERNGLRLRGTKFSSTQRLERMLSLVSVAYALMVIAGDYGEKRGIHRRLMANTSRKRTLALWRVGQYVILHMRLEVMKLLKHAAALPVA